MTNTSEQPYRDVAKATRDEIDMLIERLENMQKNGDTWLTVQSVLALLYNPQKTSE